MLARVRLAPYPTGTVRSKVKAQTDLLRAQSTEQLEGLKLELDKRAAEDVRAIAEELAALHEQVEKVWKQMCLGYIHLDCAE
eukprot:1151980-Pelagomonas_calceolata.AAC.4